MTALYIVKAKKTFLKSPLSPTGTTVILDELIDSQGNDIAMASFGEFGVVVLTQATTVEMIKFTNLSRNATTGAVTLTVATNGRDIAPVTPYAGSSTGQRFNATADAIVTNDPLTMMRFGVLNNAQTWDLKQTFSVIPETTGGNATTDNQLIRKAQLDSAVLGIVTSVSIVVAGTAGETITDGQLVYLKTSDACWWKADADATATSENVILGIAQGAGTAGNLITSGVMLRGVDDAQSGLVAGTKYYASNTAGAISTSAGTVEVSVGIAKSATELYFEPYFDQRLTEDQQDALNTTTPLSASNKVIDEASTTATPTANKIVKYDANGNLPAYKLFTTLLCAETLAVGNLIASYYYQATTITYDTKVKGTGSTTGTATLAMAVGNNTNRRIVVFISCGLGGNTNTWTPNCSYAGVAMTKLQQIGTTFTGGVTSMWTLEAPTVGANNITVDFSSAGGSSIGYTITAYSYYNVDQSTVDGSASASATTQNYTPSNTGALLLTSVMSAAAPTGGVNMQDNQQSQTRTGSELSHFDGDSGIVGSPVLSTISATGGSVIFTVGLKPASSASYGYGVKTTATTPTNGVNSNKYNSVVGFVTAVTNGGVVGETATIQTGGVVTGLTSLIPFATYYVQDTAGTIGTTAGTNSKKIGVALTTTTLLIKHDN